LYNKEASIFEDNFAASYIISEPKSIECKLHLIIEEFLYKKYGKRIVAHIYYYVLPIITF